MSDRSVTSGEEWAWVKGLLIGAVLGAFPFAVALMVVTQ